VEVVEAYQTVAPSIPLEELREMFSPPFDAVTFTSSSTASHLSQMLGGAMKELLAGSAIASIGPVTSATLRQLGLEVAVEASESTIPGLLRALVKYFSHEQ
jgi:uroporphyrinogen III methyltransferase / synthase